MNKKIQDDDLYKIKELFIQGNSFSYIGKKLGVSGSTIQKRVSKQEWYEGSEYHTPFRQLLGYENDIEKLYCEGNSVVEVHKILRLTCCSDIVKRYLKSRKILRKAKRCYSNTQETILNVRKKLEEHCGFVHDIYVIQLNGANITRNLLPFTCGYNAIRLFLRKKGWWRNRSESQSCVLKKYGNQFKITKPEQSFIDWCEEKNISYIYQYTIPGHKHNYDFYLPDYNTLSEIDGDYFHAKGKFYERQDAEKIHSRDWFLTDLATKNGYKIFRFLESEIKDKGDIVFSCLLDE